MDVGENTKCPDMSTNVGCIEDCLNYTLDTSSPSHIDTTAGRVHLITDQAYQYMLSKCTEDELFDLGWLGQSPEHCKKAKDGSLRKIIEMQNNTTVL